MTTRQSLANKSTRSTGFGAFIREVNTLPGDEIDAVFSGQVVLQTTQVLLQRASTPEEDPLPDPFYQPATQQDERTIRISTEGLDPTLYYVIPDQSNLIDATGAAAYGVIANA